MIQNNSEIGMHVELCGSSIGTNCYIQENSHIDQCVILDNCIIGPNCRLTDVIVGNNVIIGANCNLQHCKIGHDVELAPGTALSDIMIIDHQYEEDDQPFEPTEVLSQGKGYIISSPVVDEQKNMWDRSSLRVSQGFESGDEEDETDDNPDYKCYMGLKDFIKTFEQRNGENVRDIITEINCFRMSCNCTYSDIVRNLVIIMIEYCWNSSYTIKEWV